MENNKYYESSNDKVIELDYNDFNEDGTVNRNEFKDKYGIIKVYAHWCGYCKKMIPTCEYLSNNLYDNNFVVGAINLALPENKDISHLKDKINGYPTLFMVDPVTNELDMYHGSNDLKSILEYICNYTNNNICKYQ